MLGKIGDKYQSYWTVYKTHAMATHHRGAGCPVDRDMDHHIEDAETTGLENNNENTSASDATIALGGPEAEGHPDDLIHSNQAKLTALLREIIDLHQWVQAGEGQPLGHLDHIEQELQILSCVSITTSTYTYITLQRICQYTDTLCTT